MRLLYLIAASVFFAFFASAIAAQNRPTLQAPTLGIQDMPQILAAQQSSFDQTYKGRLFTARMTVNDVIDRTSRISVGFNVDETKKMFPPISCHLEDLLEAGLARQGDVLWVSGILSTLTGITISLEPCQISLTQEPQVVPRPWKTLPPRQ